MSDVDTRKCDGPNCEFTVIRNAPQTIGQIGYYDFFELQMPDGTVKHFHCLGCLKRWATDPLRKGIEK